MGKVTSLNGKVNGKVGGVVYSIVAGQTIAREYNPVVANPNTSLQVDARAKFKLMSQLAAAMAPVIAIPKDGLVSSRNQFMKVNKDIVYANAGVAQVSYENLQLTKSSTGMPGIVLNRTPENMLQLKMASEPSIRVSRVVYIIFRKNTERQLEYVRSVVVNNRGTVDYFFTEIDDIAGELAVYGYGICDKNEAASAKYANYSVNSAEDIATLVYNRTMSSADFSLTQTRGTTINSGSEQSSQPTEAGKARVYVTATGGGTATGAGVFDLNSQVTVNATPATGNYFVGWRIQGQVNYISNSTIYEFTLTGQTDLVAVFASESDNEEFNQN